MATYEIIAWREIPAVVEARDGGQSVTRPLSERFQALIDAGAMQFGIRRSAAYLAEGTPGATPERPGGPPVAAEAVAAELEGRFPEFIGRAFGRP